MERINFGLIRRAAIAIGEEAASGMTQEKFAAEIASSIVAEHPELDFKVYKLAAMVELGGETPEATAALHEEMARVDAEAMASNDTPITKMAKKDRSLLQDQLQCLESMLQDHYETHIAGTVSKDPTISGPVAEAIETALHLEMARLERLDADLARLQDSCHGQ